MSLLHADAVSARLGGATVLDAVSLKVDPGQAWAVFGPNGAGKSTLVRVLLGVLAPSAGVVLLEGRPLQSYLDSARAQALAWVAQSSFDDVAFTALETVLMGLMPRLGGWGLPSTDDERRGREVLREVGLVGVDDRPVSRLSGGERRRVFVARALLQAPKVMLLDEPTASLDARHQLGVLELVRTRVERGMGAVAVLHDVNLAERFATHVLLLKGGAVLASGLREAVLTPENLSALYDVQMVRAEGWRAQ